MSGLTGAINTALSGLNLFEAGIQAVSNNLANVSTPGYASETVTANSQTAGPGQPGDGVQPPQIIRAATGFAAGLLRAANAASQAAGNQATSLTAISNALVDNGDVQSAVNQFFEDVSTLAANPSSAAQRQTVLADAQTLSGTFQSAASSINGVVGGASATLTQSVASANNLLGQLAVLNNSLKISPNDPSLLDQQQNALNALSSLLSINVLPQSNGSIIIAAGGTILLDPSGAQTLAVVPANGGAAPTLTAGADAAPLPVTENDGAIGASVATYAAGTSALNGLNALAAILAGEVNITQAEGLTPSGTPGGALFTVPSPSVTPNAANTGTASVTATLTQAAQLPVDGGPFTLTYGAGGWTATDSASGASLAVTGTPPSFAGLTLGITGAPAVGDNFSINPAPNAATGIAAATADPNAIAAADPYVATPGAPQGDGSILDSNAGTIISGQDIVTTTPAANAAGVPAADAGATLLVTFTSATAYSIATAAAPGTAIATGTLTPTSTGGSGNIAIAYGGAASGSYWQLPITGTPVAGDVLTLSPGGPESGSNASRLAALWTATGATPAGTLQQAVIGFGTGLGANAQQAQNLSTAASAQVTTANANLQTIAGVSTDQQAVTLTNYQQAYQAAAQVISAIHTAFESLLASI